ncbi:hypothetical protein DFA_11054 [Cavenderia fasciculata]|uniref:THH1/TOM1/TOM3 domain-containing protein n=1 Tax=Cavenderia fasciculata TaxID=261658 RepID=F4QEN2_CACFS|nr:uncharacterized protein DFA_11054 [Cavenderia fasciculata]EGG13293.1 hypothetical protein DFA_11054 [Cavenderia fasciculata]|eukprot:XP_004349992.1 hypothetical protein DFA_11054 [Cavenderia fasciculata]
MAEGSFTGDPLYDKLVAAFLVIRILVSTLMTATCSVQLVYEYRYQRQNPNVFSPKLLTLVGCTFFPFSVALIGMWTTFFIFVAWVFVGCFWLQLLFILFLSSKIKLNYIGRIWKISWAVLGISLLYTLGYTLISKFAVKYSDLFYMVGFLSILGIFGTIILIFGVLLARQMKKHQKISMSLRTFKTVKKIKILSICLFFIIVSALARDLILNVIIKGIPPDSNIRYLSHFITFFLETLQGIVMMVAIADVPINYLLLKGINPTRNHTIPSSQSPNSKISIGGFRNRNNNNNTSTMSSSSSIEMKLNKKIKKKKSNSDNSETSTSSLSMTASSMKMNSDSMIQSFSSSSVATIGSSSELAPVTIIDINQNNQNNQNNNNQTNNKEEGGGGGGSLNC